MGTFLEDMNRGLREKEKKPMGFANAARLKSEWKDIHTDWRFNRDDPRYIGNVWDFGAPRIASSSWVQDPEGKWYDTNPDYVAGGLPHGRPQETYNKTWDDYYGSPEAIHDEARANGKEFLPLRDHHWRNIMYPVGSVHSWQNDLGVDGENAKWAGLWDTDDFYARKRANAPAWWKRRMY